MTDRVEVVARAICKAAGVSPDILVASGTPDLVPGGYVVPGHYAPAWQLFTAHAEAAIAAINVPMDPVPAQSIMQKMAAGRVFRLSQKDGALVITEDAAYYSQVDPSADELKQLGSALVVQAMPVT